MPTNLYIVSIPSRNDERTEAETKDKALSNVINRIISKEKGIDFNNKGYSNRGIALAKAKELYNAGVIKITEVKPEPITITIPEPKLNPQLDLFKESYSMKDAGAFDIPNSTGLLIPPSQTAPLADFKYFERYDPNQKGHRPNLSQPSKLKNIVPTREIPPPFGLADDYQKLNPNKFFDLGTDDYNIRRERVRGFTRVLSEIKSKIAEENIHGIVVTIPKSETNNLKKEDEFLQENEGTQFWNLKKNPSNLNIGDRIYFVEEGYITCYQIIDDIVKDMHCDVTDRDWTGTNLILSKEIYNLLNKISYKGFQGFRYINDDLKNKLRQASILDYPKPGFTEVLAEIKNKIALDITPDLEEQLGTDKIWVLYDNKVVISETPYTSHTALFRRLGLPTSGKAFDRITRGVYSIKDNILYLEWYGDTGKEEEFENGINRLIDEIDKAGYKDRYNSIKMNTLQKYGNKQASILDYPKSKFTEVLAEIKNKMANENFEDLFIQVEKSAYGPMNKYLWKELLNDGWPDETGSDNINDYSYIPMDIPIEDSEGLQNFDDDIVEKYNRFDIKLKSKYGTTKYLDFIDYDKGIVYLIRYNENKQASILDYPKPGLCPSVWDENEKLLTIVKDQIINKLLKFFKSQDIDLMDKDIVSKIMIIGSLTSYQYTIGNKNSNTLGSDLDCHIHFSIDKILDTFNLPAEELAELIDDKWRKELNTQSELVKGTQHPLEFYFEMEGFTTAEPTDGVYDLFADKWVKEPRTVDMDFDINEKYPEIIEYASNLAKEVDGEMGSIDRDIKDIEFLQETIQAFSKDKQKLFLDKLQNKIDEIETDIQDLINKGTKIIKDRHIEYNPYSKGNIVFKFFQRYLYLDLFSKIKKLTVDEQTEKVDVSTVEDVNKVKDIIDEFKQNA